MTHKLKIKNIKKDDILYIRQLCEENNCDFSLEWESKYNSHVVYDYEPFNSDGLMINAYIQNEYSYNAKFVEYLYNRRTKRINKLNKIFDSGVKKYERLRTISNYIL